MLLMPLNSQGVLGYSSLLVLISASVLTPKEEELLGATQGYAGANLMFNLKLVTIAVLGSLLVSQIKTPIASLHPLIIRVQRRKTPNLVNLQSFAAILPRITKK